MTQTVRPASKARRKPLFLAVGLLVAGLAAQAQGGIPPEFRALFQEVVLKHEYEGTGGKPLVRWEVPVHLTVSFGASVGARDRGGDMKAVSKVAGLIAGATRHPVTVGAGGNFHVFVVDQAELGALGPVLQQAGLTEYAARAITRMPRNTNCQVVALPERDKTKGYRRAVAVVRADLPPEGRASCYYEEIAQGMGLPDDCQIRQTIFNDDNEYATFTPLDLALLQVTYDPRLTSGMQPGAVMQVLDGMLAEGG